MRPRGSRVRRLRFCDTDFAAGLFTGRDFARFSRQPTDGPELARNTMLASDYCLRHPRRRRQTVGIR